MKHENCIVIRCLSLANVYIYNELDKTTIDIIALILGVESVENKHFFLQYL